MSYFSSYFFRLLVNLSIVPTKLRVLPVEVVSIVGLVKKVVKVNLRLRLNEDGAQAGR